MKFQAKSPENELWKLHSRHLHAVPSSEVFVYDLPASQVAHSTRDLDGHVHQVLLRDSLKGNGTDSDNVQLRETGNATKRRGSCVFTELY